MYKTFKKLMTVVVPFLTRLAKPILDAYRDETTPRKKTVVVAQEPVAEPVVVAPAVKVLAPIPLPVIPVPVLVTLGVIRMPATAPRKPVAARKTNKAAKTQPKPTTAPTLYRKTRRGDRYEVATNAQAGDVLYVRVARGKSWRYQPADMKMAG